MLINEQWRIYKDPFLVSNLGRVFNFKDKRFIKPYFHKSRCGVYLRHGLGKSKIMTHKLVAMVYPDLVPRACLSHTQLDHLDGNTLNPAATNIFWKTAGDNQRAFQASRYVTYNGETIRALIRKPKKVKKK